MVCDWGMSDLGPISFGENQDHIFLGREIARDEHISEHTAQEIDARVRGIIDEQLQRARLIISENRDKLDIIADELLIRETIDGADVYKIMDGTFVRTDKEEWEKSRKPKPSSEAQPESDGIADAGNPVPEGV